MRLLIHATIQSDAYNVFEAADGNEAWMLIQLYKPALVLLDIQMPGRSGLDILGSIRSDPNLKATRVILLTAKALASDVEAGMRAGADLYLTKPFSPLELLTRTDEAVLRWRSMQAAPTPTAAVDANPTSGGAGRLTPKAVAVS